jgi:hypothetical protein
MPVWSYTVDPKPELADTCNSQLLVHVESQYRFNPIIGWPVAAFAGEARSGAAVVKLHILDQLEVLV